ncbi:MAG: beta strand repeat-containing protein, partial [Hyphococcus sp.]
MATGANAQTVTDIGVDLGPGADKGAVAGGSVSVVGGPDVRGIGVSTGTGSDQIENTDAIDVTVFAEDVVFLSGLTRREEGAAVRAEGIGFYGDNGKDVLVNTGDITVLSTGAASVTNLGLNLIGFFNYNTPSTVDAFSIGIDGGRAQDVIDNRGVVVANAVSSLFMTGRNPSSVAQDALVSITSNATTFGMRGTRNGEATINSGELVLGASATASSSTLDIEIVNGVVVDSSTNANAVVVGMEGDTIRDWMTNHGAIVGVASANASRGSIALSLSDGDVGDTSINVFATSAGLRGGMSDDRLFNNGDVMVSAGAAASSTSVEINLIDVAGGSFNLAPESYAVGIDGGDHDDLLDNAGSITAAATSMTTSNAANLSLLDATIIGGRIAAGFDSGARDDEGPPVQATAVGLSGGDGEDALINRTDGVISLTGGADADSVTVSVAAVGVPDAAFQAIFAGESLASLDTFASSRIVGMDGGLRDDSLMNYGDIVGETLSAAQQVGVAVSVPAGFLPNEAGFLPGFTLGGAGAAAWSDAVGMIGAGGGDMLANLGKIDLMSTADALAVGVSVEIPDVTSGDDGVAFDLSLTLADVATESDAFATGVAGGDGDDTLSNGADAEIDVDSVAIAASTGVGVTAAIEKEGVVSEGVVVRASTDAQADATAMNGGAGDDLISNEGKADAAATATASTVGVTVALEGVAGGGAAGVAAVDGSANADATAQAITGGDGADLLLNTGALDADATANASATGVSVALTGAKQGGFAGAGAVSITGATATADASGVDWSSNDQGAENRGSIETTATANAVGDSVSVAVSGTLAGLTLDASIADSSTTAIATASAFDAPSGDHAITNFETLGAVSTATADSDSIGVELGVAAKGGVAAGVSLTRAVTDATATSTGIVSDLGVDRVANLGTIDADATAHANATSLAVAVNGTLAGVSLNAAGADGSATAAANATGVSTGAFDDDAITAGTLRSNATATANADSIAVQLAITAKAGVAAGGALTRGEVTGSASAMGVATGAGADRLAASGVVDVSAVSSADADAVSVAGQGTAAGLTLGAALVEASTTANADASALNAGSGDDRVENTSALTAMAMANANSTSVGVQIGAAGAGLAGGLSLANASTEATAATGAVEGGLGADSIMNTAALDVDAHAEASGASVSVSLNGALTGGSASVALTDATVDATAYATALAGDDASRPVSASEAESAEVIAQAGDENADTLINMGAILVDSVAKSAGASVSVAAPVAFVPAGFALATAENTATGAAYGIDGGLGDDVVINMADLTVNTDVGVSGASVAASVSVLALGGFDGTADSDAVGVAGGWGDDFLFNDAIVDANAMATATGVTVGLNLAGGSVGDLGTLADADVFGMFGGDGADMLMNDLEVIADADAVAESTNVTFTVAGFSVNDVSTKAFADATGLGGGAGGDLVNNAADVTAISLARTPTVSVSLNGVGAIFNDAETRSQSAAYGLSGDDGDDALTTSGAVTATATAETTGVGVSVSLASGGDADVETIADASAIGAAGGDGADALLNEGAITSTATSTAATTGVNATILGAAFADADAKSLSYAVGIS